MLLHIITTNESFVPVRLVPETMYPPYVKHSLKVSGFVAKGRKDLLQNSVILGPDNIAI